jgi:hypothetical protein
LILFLAGLACIAASLICSYMCLSEVRSKLQLWFVLEWQRNRGEFVRYCLRILRSLTKSLEAADKRDAQRTAESVVNSTRHEKTRIAEVKTTLAAFLEELTARKAELAQQEYGVCAEMLASLQSRYRTLLEEGVFLLSIPAERLGMRRFKSLLSWRGHVEDLARAGVPIILPDEELAEIRRGFEPERRSLRQSESFAQQAAWRKVQRIRAAARGYRERIESRRDQRRVWVARINQQLARYMDSGSMWLAGNDRDVKESVAKMNRYHEIRFFRYLSGLFCFCRVPMWLRPERDPSSVRTN